LPDLKVTKRRAGPARPDFAAGAKPDAAGYPAGNERVDEVLRRHGAKA